jgi:hypothetical protein
MFICPSPKAIEVVVDSERLASTATPFHDRIAVATAQVENPAFGRRSPAGIVAHPLAGSQQLKLLRCAQVEDGLLVAQ